MLYKKALTEQVPYFKFYSWIESTVQKEVIQQLFKAKKASSSKIPKDLIMEDRKGGKKPDMTPRTAKKQETAAQKNDMKNQLISFLSKAKDIKMPKMPGTGTKKSARQTES